MKIVVLSSYTPSLFWFRIDMMKAFQQCGHQVIAVGPDSSEKWNDSFKEVGIEYRQVFTARNGMNPITDVKSYFALKEFFKQEKPDKLFVYQAKAISYGSVAAKKYGKTEIYPLVAGLGSIFRGTGLKNWFLRMAMSVLYKNAFRYADKVFMQNQDDVNDIVNAGVLKRDKIVMMNGSGVNTEKFCVKDFPNVPTFLFIGRLIRDKGVGEYLDACRIIKRNYKTVCCLLVGPYDSNPSALKPDELKTYIDDGSVQYFGEQKDVRPFIEQASVYVLPSYHEGTPKTVLEAMSMGRAIITTDAPGCRETVIDGINGCLVPVKNVEAIVEKMEYLIDNFAEVERMGKESRAIAVERFDVNKVNASVIKTMGL